MQWAQVQRNSIFEWAVASAPIPGGVESGDLHLVTETDAGVTIAVVDGLGHGEQAAVAARTALAAVLTHAGRPLEVVMKACHAALSGSRGVVMNLAFVERETGELEWLGVGNVFGILLRADPATEPRLRCLLIRGGVLGYRLPRLLPMRIPLAAGDLLIIATDGIRPEFSDRLDVHVPIGALAAGILAGNATGRDDALVLAARFLGEGP